MNQTTKIAIISGISLATVAGLQAPSFAVEFTLSNGTDPNSLTFIQWENLLGQRFTPSRATPTGNPQGPNSLVTNPAAAAGAGATVYLKNFEFFGVTQVDNLTDFSTLYVYELSPTAQNVQLGQDPSNITAPGWTKIGTATGGLNGTTATWNFAGNGLTVNTSGTQYVALAGSFFTGDGRTNSYTPASNLTPPFTAPIPPFNTVSTGIRPLFDPANPNQAQISSSAVNPQFSALFDTVGQSEIPENFSTLPGFLALGAFFGVSKLTRKKSA
jgi:hypothetical protein